MCEEAVPPIDGRKEWALNSFLCAILNGRILNKY